jgi:hypothetical protein
MQAGKAFMLSRIPTTQIVHAGMIVLALMASLPKVVCCCNISWGPGGLLAGKAVCKECCVAAKSCCDQHLSSDNVAHNSSGCQASKGRCSFTILSPAPISESRSVELDQTLVIDVVLLPSWARYGLEVEPGSRWPIADAAPPLAPARAFLQTWLI